MGLIRAGGTRHRGAAAERGSARTRAVSVERLRADVENLIGPRSRLHAPEKMDAADAYIAAALRDAGWTVASRPFVVERAAGYLDLGTHTQGQFGPTVYPELRGRNIVAVKEGARPEAVVVVAHHDTIRDSPGANDNTASVASLLELGRLVTSTSYERTLLLVAVDMEEIGFHGSRAFLREQLDGRPVRGAIVYESMGYTSHAPDSQRLPRGFAVLYPRQARQIHRRRRVGDWTAVLYRGSSADLADSFAASLEATDDPDASVLLRDPTDFPLLGPLLRRYVPFARDFGRSDHVAFWERGLPAIMVTDTAEFRSPHYHQPTDTVDTVDFEHLRRIVAATSLTLDEIAGRRDSGDEGSA